MHLWGYTATGANESVFGASSLVGRCVRGGGGAATGGGAVEAEAPEDDQRDERPKDAAGGAERAQQRLGEEATKV